MVIFKKRIFQLIVLVVLLGCCALYPFEWIHHNKFLPVIALLCMIGLTAFVYPEKYPLNNFDFIFLSFIIWNGVSVIWAKQISLVWPVLAGYLLIFLMYKFLQTLPKQKLLELILLMSIISLISISYVIFSTLIEKGTFSWHHDDLKYFNLLIGENSNYVNSVLLMLIPFQILCFDLYRKHRWWIGILIFSSCGFVVLLNSRATTILLAIQIFVYLSVFFKNKNPKIILSSTLFGLLFIASIFTTIEDKTRFLYDLNPFKSTIHDAGYDRLSLWQHTINIFQKNWLTGVGSGNWHIENLAYNSGIYRTFFDKAGFFTHPHNQVLHILAENGIVGGFLVFAILTFCILLAFKHLRKNKWTKKGVTPLIILFSYIFLSAFYGVDYPTIIDYNLRIPIFIFINTFAILSTTYEPPKNYFHPSFLCIIILPLSFFYYLSSTKLDTFTRFRQNNQTRDFETAHSELKNLYDSTWYAFHRGHSIKSLQATTLKRIGNDTQAFDLMINSLDEFPYFYNWYQLGTWYKNIEQAEICFHNAYLLHSTYFEAQLKLCEIAIQKGSMEEASKWLSFFDQLRPNNGRERKTFHLEKGYLIRTHKKYRKEVKKLQGDVTLIK